MSGFTSWGMARLLRFMILLLLCGAMTGCALYVDRRFRDVSEEPRYAVDYHVGDSFRLRSDGQVVSCLSDKNEKIFELWSPEVVSQNAGSSEKRAVVVSVPAGSIIRIDGLEQSYIVMFPIPLPGDSEVLTPYGTLSTPVGTWQHVRITSALNAKWSFVRDTHVMAFPPDGTFLERIVPADARNLERGRGVIGQVAPSAFLPLSSSAR